jgi:ribosomal protein S18 acetylase RimI-like enzyme
MSAVEITHYDDPTHRAQVAAIWRETFGYEAAHNRPDVVIDKKVLASDGLFFVAVTGSTVVGTIMAGYDGHRGWLYSLAVSPPYRRQRIGSRLVSVAEQALRDRGCLKINLQIVKSNESVAAFYESLGYSVEERISMGKCL